MQHTRRLSCAGGHLPKVQKDSSAVGFDSVEIAFLLALFHWLKPLTNKGGKESGVTGENLENELQKMPHIKA